MTASSPTKRRSPKKADDPDESGFGPGGKTGADGDDHLPASESEELSDEKKRHPPIERGLTELPPD